MIVFISRYPTEDNEKDGMLQRVKSIDKICNLNRRYIEISFKKNIKIVKYNYENIEIIKLNYFLHQKEIADLLVGAKFVYCHSIDNAIRVIKHIKKYPFIIDAHGAYPEELMLQNKKILSKVYSFFEKKIIVHCYKVVCVTESMWEHFNIKYKISNNKKIIIPIVSDSVVFSEVSSFEKKENIVIYSGGLQKWQNIDLMLELASKNNLLSYKFLTGMPEELKFKITGMEIKKTDVFSVKPDDVVTFYKTAMFGFMLRDDIIVNNVACPTKYLEYIASDIIPIVKTENIGDFKKIGIKTISIKDFLANKLPVGDEFEMITKFNKYKIKTIIDQMNDGLAILENIFYSKGN